MQHSTLKTTTNDDLSSTLNDIIPFLTFPFMCQNVTHTHTGELEGIEVTLWQTCG